MTSCTRHIPSPRSGPEGVSLPTPKSVPGPAGTAPGARGMCRDLQWRYPFRSQTFFFLGVFDCQRTGSRALTPWANYLGFWLRPPVLGLAVTQPSPSPRRPALGGKLKQGPPSLSREHVATPVPCSSQAHAPHSTHRSSFVLFFSLFHARPLRPLPVLCVVVCALRVCVRLAANARENAEPLQRSVIIATGPVLGATPPAARKVRRSSAAELVGACGQAWLGLIHQLIIVRCVFGTFICQL
jgi:hypothetical protein